MFLHTIELLLNIICSKLIFPFVFKIEQKFFRFVSSTDKKNNEFRLKQSVAYLPYFLVIVVPGVIKYLGWPGGGGGGGTFSHNIFLMVKRNGVWWGILCPRLGSPIILLIHSSRDSGRSVNTSENLWTRRVKLVICLYTELRKMCSKFSIRLFLLFHMMKIFETHSLDTFL